MRSKPMDMTDFYDLPMLVGEQYRLTSELREARDTGHAEGFEARGDGGGAAQKRHE